jgi:hypothetical protein
MKELEQAMRPVILQPGRPLVELARALSSLDADQLMTALGVDTDVRFDFVVGRDLFTRLPAPDRAALARLLVVALGPCGALSLAQVISRLGQRLSSPVRLDSPAAAKKLEKAEERAYSDPSNDLVSWSHEELSAAFREAGAREVSVETETMTDTRPS